MLIFQVFSLPERQRPPSEVTRESLLLQKKNFAWGDMPKELEAMVNSGNAYIGTYVNRLNGRSYARFLLKSEDGEFYDYRMFDRMDGSRFWVSEERWKNMLGLDREVYDINIDKLQLEEVKKIHFPSLDVAAGEGPFTVSKQDVLFRPLPRRVGDTSFSKAVASGEAKASKPKTGGGKKGAEKPKMIELPEMVVSPKGIRHPESSSHYRDFRAKLSAETLDPVVFRGLFHDQQKVEKLAAKRVLKLPVLELKGTHNWDSNWKEMMNAPPRISQYDRYPHVDGKPVEIETGFQGILARLTEEVETGEGRQKLIDIIKKYCAIYQNVSVEAACALFATESLVVKNARSPSGCRGLGQLSSGTAAQLDDYLGNPIFTVKNARNSEGRVVCRLVDRAELYDVEKNIHGSIVYLSEQLRDFSSLPLALAAYNDGPGSADEFLKTGKFFRLSDNNPRMYALRAANFERFFRECQVGNLSFFSVEEFMESPPYVSAYNRVSQYAYESTRGGRPYLKPGYLSEGPLVALDK